MPDIKEISNDPDFLKLSRNDQIDLLVDLGISEADIDLFMSAPKSGPFQLGEPPNISRQLNEQLFGGVKSGVGGAADIIGGMAEVLNPASVIYSLSPFGQEKAMEQQMQIGEEAFRGGRPVEGALRTAAASVPYLGPAAASTFDVLNKYASAESTPQERRQAIGNVLGAVAAPKVYQVGGSKLANLRVAGGTPKAFDMLYEAIRPEAMNTREFSRHLEAAVPYIFAARKGRVAGMADMERAALQTMNRLWDLHIKPVVSMNNNLPVNTAEVAAAIRSRITQDMPKGLAKSIERQAKLYDNPRTLGDLDSRISDLNASNKLLQDKTGSTAKRLRRAPETGWKFDEVSSLRKVLADKVGELTGQREMYTKLRKDWGSLSEVHEGAQEAAKLWEHQQKIERAPYFPAAGKIAKRAGGALGFGGAATLRRGLGEAGELVHQYMANPDKRVRAAFRRLREDPSMPREFPQGVQLPERRLLPGPGETTGAPFWSAANRQYMRGEDWLGERKIRLRERGRRTLPPGGETLALEAEQKYLANKAAHQKAVQQYWNQRVGQYQPALPSMRGPSILPDTPEQLYPMGKPGKMGRRVLKTPLPSPGEYYPTQPPTISPIPKRPTIAEFLAGEKFTQQPPITLPRGVTATFAHDWPGVGRGYNISTPTVKNSTIYVQPGESLAGKIMKWAADVRSTGGDPGF
jgi:hypothetical protein